MNKAKKLASLLLALVMALALAAPAFAQETGGKFEDNDGIINITNAKEGVTYTLYRIFDLESFDTTPADAYSYVVGAQWLEFLQAGYDVTDDAGKTTHQNIIAEYDDEGKVTNNGFIKVDPTEVTKADGTKETINYVSWVEGKESMAPAFAAEAIKYAKANNIAAAGTGTADKDGTYSFKNLPLGYYLISSDSDGALCSLDTTNKTANVTEKRTEPTIGKEVKENSTGEYDKSNDASIGDTVEYKTTVTTGETIDGAYTLHDIMSAGLTFSQIDKIEVDGKTFTANGKADFTVKGLTAATVNTDYTITVKAPGATHDKDAKDNDLFDADGNKVTRTCAFELVFPEEWLETVGTQKQIIVYYSAVLNENAEIAGEGNTNLTYMEGNFGSTEESTTRTYTYEFDLVKMDGNTKKLLEGAQFKLYKKAKVADGATGTLNRYDPEDPVTFSDGYQNETDKDGWVVYTVDTTADNDLITIESGKVIIRGLDAGTYYLVEMAAPNGYNKLEGEVEITLAGNVDETSKVAAPTVKVENTAAHKTGATVDGKYPDAVYDDSDANIGGVAIANLTGTQLPSTGGIGTTIFYIVGGVLAAGAVILLITKRRMNIDK